MSKFIPQRKNANKHTQRGLKELENSIQRDGWIGAVTVAADGETFDGSARIETLTNVMPDAAPIVIDVDGHTPVIVRRTDIPNADDPRAKRLAVAANRIAQIDLDWSAEVLAEIAQQEGDLLAGLFNDDELAELIGQGETKEETVDAGELVDKAAELQKKWQVRRGDVWEIGRHRLMCGDSTSAEDVAWLMRGEKAQSVFTSPPYGVGVEYGTYKDTIENLREMLPKLSHTWLDIVLDGGFAVVNFGDIASGRNVANSKEPCEYPMSIEYFPVFRRDGWALWSRRIWCKPNPRVHSPWCIQSNRAATDWEHVWTWKKQGEPIIKRVKNSPLGWFDTSKDEGVNVGKETHGAGMATSAARRMIELHSNAGGIVHEPFTGTGTTLVACEQTGRVGRGMEIEPKYCAVTLERLSLLGLTPRRVES